MNRIHIPDHMSATTLTWRLISAISPTFCLVAVLAGSALTAGHGASYATPHSSGRHKAPAECQISIRDPRCELQHQPLGVDRSHPELSWTLRDESDDRGLVQSAYRIQVATSFEKLASGKVDLWDSGVVRSSNQIGVEYAGAPLTAGTKCFWHLKVWDGKGVSSAWSKVESWTVGPINATDWKGQWIAAVPEKHHSGMGTPAEGEPGNAAVMLRKGFDVKGGVKRAEVNLCGLGYSELSVNGTRIGDHVLDPGFTDFQKHILYVTYDVTAQIKSGANAVGILLGGGWYNLGTPDLFGFEKAPWSASPRALFQLRIEYADGSVETVVSDPSWKWSTGAIQFNCVRGGETIDARLDQKGWSTPEFADSAWKPAVTVPAPVGKLVSQQHPAIRVTEGVEPVKITEPKPGVYVFDLGVNIAGWASLHTHGTPGTKITLEYNEALLPSGEIDRKHTSSHTYGRFQTDEFILAGNGEEAFEPRFTYHGFRYVQVTGLTAKPELNALQGRVVTTDPPRIGQFTCSDERINHLQDLFTKTLLNNMHSIPTDCPQREKMGWMDDGCVDVEMALMNFDTNNFYRKWIADMIDAQDANGHVPDIVPTSGWGRSTKPGSPGEMADPWWGGAIVMAPWKLYVYCGDIRVIKESYSAMKAYVDFMTTTAKDHVVSWGLGDWLDESAGGGGRRVPVAQTSTAAYSYFASIIADSAKLLGKSEDAATYAKLAKDIRTKFNATFLNRATGAYAPDSQTAEAIPLYTGLAPAEDAAGYNAVVKQLVNNVTITRKNHISSGIVGTLYVFQALMLADRNDLAYKMLTAKGLPGWYYMVDNGATSLWEDWEGHNSLNHPALGCVGFWLYEGAAGIRPDASKPGFKRFEIVAPVGVGLEWVNCGYNSPHGRIVNNWRRDQKRMVMQLSVPVNTTAVFKLPAPFSVVRDNDKPLTKVTGLRTLQATSTHTVLEAGSGDYEISFPIPPAIK